MKRACIAAVLASTIAMGGCIGSFTLTKKLYSWNERATNDRYVNSAILWVLAWIPVYEVTLFVDFVFLNTVEFWSGKNPMAFTGPQKLEKVVTSNGKTFKVTMGNNAMTIDRLDGSAVVRELALRYDAATSSIYRDDSHGVPTRIGSISPSRSSRAAAAMMRRSSPSGKTMRLRGCKRRRRSCRPARKAAAEAGSGINRIVACRGG